MVVKINIPEGVQLHVEKGQQVGLGDPFYSTHKESHVVLPLAKKLGVKPHLIFQHVSKVVGTEVKPGDTLASAKKLFGTKNVLSDYEGIVIQIDHESGNMTLNIASEESQTVGVYFAGTIQEIDVKNSLILVDIGKAEDFACSEVSSNFGGGAFAFSEKEYFSTDSEDTEGKAVLVEDNKSYIEGKLAALGAAGIVYATGDTPTDVPYAKLSNTKSFTSLIETCSPRRSILTSSHEKKVYVYN